MSTDLAVRPRTGGATHDEPVFVDTDSVPDRRWQHVTNVFAALAVPPTVAAVLLYPGDTYLWAVIAAMTCAAVALRALFEESR